MEALEFQGLIERISGLTDGQRAALIEAVRAKGVSRRGRPADRQALRCGAPLPALQVGGRGHVVEAQAADALQMPGLQADLHESDRDAAGASASPRRLARLHAQALADGASLRKAAKRCGIVLDTSFRWRHRFLRLPKQRKATAVSGIVEVDETYFLRSQKGARKVAGRKARKRGGSFKARTLARPSRTSTHRC